MNLANKRVLVDFDSVLNNLHLAMIHSCNLRFGTAYEPANIAHWEWWSENTLEEHNAFVWGPECFGCREWTVGLPAMPGSLRGLWRLHQIAQPIIVSDRRPEQEEWIHAWLRRRGGPLNIPIIVTDRHERTKAMVAQEMGLTVVVEDAPHHAETFAAMGGIERVYLLDHPWNQGVSPHPKITRVSGWKDIV